MATHLGHVPPSPSADAVLRITLHDGPLELSWPHCGASAEFIGEFFGNAAGRAGLDANDARHSIGYLANELLENAVKFRAPGGVEVEVRLDEATFALTIANLVSTKTAAAFQVLLEELVAGDPGDLLIARIEANAEDPDAGGSGLGLLTLMNDYGARLGWSFEPDGDTVRLTTYAALTLS